MDRSRVCLFFSLSHTHTQMNPLNAKNSAQSLCEAHSRGITREQIEHSLRIMPFVSFIHPFIPPPWLLSEPTNEWKKQHPAMTRAITTLHSKGKSTFLCLSNSNSIFISTILNSKTQSQLPQPQPQEQEQEKAPQPLSNLFAEIITNPATWQGDLLKLDRRIPPSSPHQHTCQIGCSPNMCKGKYN